MGKTNKIVNEKVEEKLKEKTKETKKKVEKTMTEYKKFAMKGNAVDLAIGMVIGSAFTSIINAIVNTTITPLLSVFTNKVDFSKLFISLSGVHYDSIEKAQEAGALVWNYGALLNALLNFFIVSFILFLVVKYIGKLNKKSEVAEVEEKKVTTKKCPYCISEIPIEAVKCAHCTSNLEEVE